MFWYNQYLNLSIKLNSFPRSCKIAKVKPLFKKGSKTDPQNYCPISLLPLLSKITEMIFHVQTEEFLSKNKLLYRFHSDLLPDSKKAFSREWF